MSSLREDNHRLAQTVSDLRDSRRTDERKMRDLEHQLDELRAKQVSQAVVEVPSLPVEVAQPTPASSTAPRWSRRIRRRSSTRAMPPPARPAAIPDDDDTSRPRRHRGRRPGPRPRRRHPRPSSSRRRPRRVTHAARTAPHADAPPGDRAADGATCRIPRRGRDAQGRQARGRDHVRSSRTTHITTTPTTHSTGSVRPTTSRRSTSVRSSSSVPPSRRTRGGTGADALLKVLGYHCYQALGQTDRARAVLEQVVNLYPKTEPAALAAKRLETP